MSLVVFIFSNIKWKRLICDYVIYMFTGLVVRNLVILAKHMILNFATSNLLDNTIMLIIQFNFFKYVIA